jgi:uncharacterized SAM-binding protein YcdF (DUF218 family)
MPSSMIVRGLGLGTLALFFLAAFTPLPVFVYEMITVPVHIERADAIVVLAGGGVMLSGQLTDSSLRRTVRGIALYRDGLAPLLVLSGAAGRRSESAARSVLAGKCGVPDTAILASSAGHTTHEEVAALQPLLKARGVRRLILVTDGAHMRRAMGLVRDAGFEVLAAPVSEVETPIQPEPRLRLLRAALREGLALVYYHIAGYL